MSIEKELADIDAKADKAKAAARTKHQVLAALGDVADKGVRVLAHPNALWGYKGSIQFGDTYGGNHNHPSVAMLRVLMTKYPPVPMAKVDDGCCSFRPMSDDGAALLEKERERAEVTRVYPVKVDIDSFQTPHSAKINWHGHIEGCGLWEFEIIVPLQMTRLGEVQIEYERTQKGHESKRISRSFFRPAPGIGCGVVTWAGSGESTVPKNFTLWWYNEAGPGKHDDNPTDAICGLVVVKK